MNQQINLYKGYDKKSKAPFYLFIILFVFLVLASVVFSAYLQNEIAALRVDVRQQQSVLADAEAHTAKMRIQHPQKEHNSLLEKRTKQSKTLRKSLLDVMSLLSDTTSDKTQGFSRYFTAFAQQKTSGLWITGVTINAEQNSIDLNGRTNNAENVPIFLQKLHNETIFNGKVFTNLNMNTDSNSNELSFNINTLLVDSVDSGKPNIVTINKKPITTAIMSKIKGSRR